jgi:hemolysin activation/secretion protein
LRRQDLESAMLELRELPGLSGASAILAEGQGSEGGVTDVRVTLGPGQSKTGPTVSLRADNFGSPQVSRGRIAESFWDGNLTGHGDEVRLQIVHGLSPSDLRWGDLRLAMPVSGDGTKLNAHVSAGDFAVGGDLALLNMRGTGVFYGVSATRPLSRSRQQSVIAEIGLDVNNSNLKMDFDSVRVPVGEDRIRKLRLGSTWDKKSGRRRDLVSVYVHQGLGGFLGGTGSSRVGADNAFTKLTLEAARQQRINDLTSVNFGFAGQLSTKTLLVGEEMAIGGADSVRGYPQSMFIGDSGIQANLEFRYSPPGLNRSGDSRWLQAFQWVAFVDHGKVFDHNAQPGDTKPGITGAGVGFRAVLGSAEKPYNLRCDIGVPLSGHKPNDGGVQPYVRLDHQF